jgi:hypothetical protein
MLTLGWINKMIISPFDLPIQPKSKLLALSTESLIIFSFGFYEMYLATNL